MVPVVVGGDSRASNKPQALSKAPGYPWQLYERQPPKTKSVEILNNPNLTTFAMREGRGGRKGRTNIRFGAGNKLHNLAWLERTTHVTQETLYQSA